ncbi:MAG: hypothetical protein SNJ73_05100 [Acetobacteraceae bacterium]
MNRRRLVLACAAVAALPLPARAFRLEQADDETAADLAAACQASSLHDALRAEIEALLQGREPPAALAEALDRLDALDRLSVCPFCGCRIALAEAAPGS